MSKSQRKRKNLLDQAVRSLAASDGVTPNSELMISDYSSSPVTPSKPPSNKRGKTDKSSDDIISTLSDLINNRADGMEKLINNNAMRIEGLKKTVDFICAEEVLPEEKIKLPDVIDTVHRLGSRMHTDKLRHVILQFTSRVHRGAVWTTARNNSFLRDNKQRFAEDFCEED
ncbi:hypothetical protein DPX16_23880 [Anabarilius grahami]|uniref:Uncharacterized protein n=1 Tax=Anabarilius grahami TaxID=495550 RepID=A0A3N0YWY6_ANAGA|nr:hypothetical protein DPX16_23880 [Anabarilius grahami]